MRVGTSRDQAVPGQVPDDGVQQSRRIGGRIEVSPVFPEAEEGFLRGVARVIPAAEDTGGVPDQPGRLPVEELPECLGVTGRDPHREHCGRGRFAFTSMDGQEASRSRSVVRWRRRGPARTALPALAAYTVSAETRQVNRQYPEMGYP